MIINEKYKELFYSNTWKMTLWCKITSKGMQVPIEKIDFSGNWFIYVQGELWACSEVEQSFLFYRDFMIDWKSVSIVMRAFGMIDYQKEPLSTCIDIIKAGTWQYKSIRTLSYLPQRIMTIEQSETL